MLPAKYSFMEQVGALPKLIVASLNYIGLKEYPGASSNNPVIMNMAKDLGVSNIYKNDEMAWCALYMSHLCKITDKPMPFTGYDILRAKSFEHWGNTSPKPSLGDVLVFKRPAGSHVGLYVAESNKTFFVLGGNQSNSVSFTEIDKSRLTAARRFYATAPPASVKQYIITSSGVVSRDED
ncbi:TIGR02594 family protein [Polluticoccus soli]|uniref:TIGR02594 family protein n=1 Tax=Polluticoccus soli TaxID=3034150 RepID=UPI0023E346E0|nr:TIGR02594 family protein [Flavipsychrobacter sp. JY13-12]